MPRSRPSMIFCPIGRPAGDQRAGLRWTHTSRCPGNWCPPDSDAGSTTAAAVPKASTAPVGGRQDRGANTARMTPSPRSAHGHTRRAGRTGIIGPALHLPTWSPPMHDPDPTTDDLAGVRAEVRRLERCNALATLLAITALALTGWALSR